MTPLARTIRPYQAADAVPLTQIHNSLHPNQPRTPDQFHRRVAKRAWVVQVTEAIVGYTAVFPIPDLPGLYELEGFVAPARQRQGLGTALWQHLRTRLPPDARELSVPVADVNSPAAHFLRQLGFFVEHEEQTMRLSPLPVGPPPPLPPNCALHTVPRQRAQALFLRLYDASFAGTPWYQPFTPVELAATLKDAQNLYFLWRDDKPLGFAWVRPKGNTAEIEPIGVIQTEQGRGYGRYLLQALLHRLAAQGIQTVTLGVWASNTAAIRLYQSLGFTHVHTLTYLAYNV